MAVARNIITRSGSWYSFGDLRIAQGRDNVRVYMKENPDFCAEVEKKLREDLLAQRAGAQAADDKWDDVGGGDETPDLQGHSIGAGSRVPCLFMAHGRLP